MARLLFVVWNDSDLPAQFSVPPDCGLAQITSQPVKLEETTELDGFLHAELMLDASRVRVAYMVDLPDGVQINRIEPVPVDSDWMLPEAELDALAADEARDAQNADQ